LWSWSSSLWLLWSSLWLLWSSWWDRRPPKTSTHRECLCQGWAQGCPFLHLRWTGGSCCRNSPRKREERGACPCRRPFAKLLCRAWWSRPMRAVALVFSAMQKANPKTTPAQTAQAPRTAQQPSSTLYKHPLAPRRSKADFSQVQHEPPRRSLQVSSRSSSKSRATPHC